MSASSDPGPSPVESTRVAQSGELPHSAGDETAVGTRIDRYLVLSVLGAGAMGVVFQVYDAELDRQVALKLLKNYGGDQALARTRLRREAQALAKLNHENVVTVYDVGLHEGQVFVTMEFVEGRTLTAWQTEAPRSWREIVEVFICAGQGLAAAHREGLIHRDFKPDNVMIGADGRVRVMDFGLARRDSERASSEEPTLESSRDIEASVSGTLDLKLTRTGSSMGTPAYMAPEQFEGHDVTARSDQFGFCVALYEALYRKRPFVGEDYRALARAVLEGELLPPPSRSEVPGWLGDIVLQGLARESEGRHASMDALLAQLAAGELRRRRHRLLIAVGVAGLCVAAGLGYQGWELEQRVASCERAGNGVAEVWNAEARQGLRAALESTGLSYAAATAERVEGRIDEQAERWRETATLACSNERVRELWDAETGAKARWCLEDRRSEIGALVAAFNQSEDAGLKLAVKAAASLSSVASCVEPSVLVHMSAPPPVERWPALDEVRGELWRAEYLNQLAKHDEALVVANAAEQHAEGLGFAPLLAAAKLRQAAVLEQQASYDNASAIALAAYREGARAQAWDIAADAAVILAQIDGFRGAKPELGAVWIEQAELAAFHHGAPNSLREAKRLSVIAAQHYTNAEYAEAQALFEQILALIEAELGARHPSVAKVLNNLGVVAYSQQRFDEARAYYERAVELSIDVLAPEHPESAISLLNLANIHVGRGDAEQAKPLYNRALAIQEASMGPEHPDLALTLSNIAHCHEQLGELDEAFEIYARSLGIRERALGFEHPQVAWSLSGLAAIHGELGKHAEAVPLLERSLRIREASLPATHMLIGETLTSLGDNLVKLGELERGLELLERAQPIIAGEGVLPIVRAEGESALARALWVRAEGDEQVQARALELAHRARGHYVEVGKAEADELAKIDAWLAEREG